MSTELSTFLSLHIYLCNFHLDAFRFHTLLARSFVCVSPSYYLLFSFLLCFQNMVLSKQKNLMGSFSNIQFSREIDEIFLILLLDRLFFFVYYHLCSWWEGGVLNADMLCWNYFVLGMTESLSWGTIFIIIFFFWLTVLFLILFGLAFIQNLSRAI